MGKFVIHNTNTGVKFDLKASNGEVIATSEVYSSLDACRNGVESVKKNAPVANVEDQTVEGFETVRTPSSRFTRTRAASSASVLRLQTDRSSPLAKATRLWQAARTASSRL